MAEKLYLSCAETAKLVRAALKEAFPGVKFSVRSHTYAGGASIDVDWTDGPNGNMVEGVAKRFAGAYFDSMTDYKGANYHNLDGKPVRFCADFIFCNRHFSDELIAKAIDSLWRWGCWPEALKPTVADYRNGYIWRVNVPGYGDIGRELNVRLAKLSDRLGPAPSPTAERVRFTGDDNYPELAAKAREELLAARAGAERAEHLARTRGFD